jgi:hypothetical protein
MLRLDQRPEGLEGQRLHAWQALVRSMKSLSLAGEKFTFTAKVAPGNTQFTLGAAGVFIQVKVPTEGR